MMMRKVVFIFFGLAASPCAAAIQAQGTQVQVVVPAHDIKRGDVIAASDLAFVNALPSPAVNDLLTSEGDLEGMEARRMLHAGEPLRRSDVRRPILVTKGSTVTLTFHSPGIELVAIGKAMSEGGAGETVTVLNPVSYRQVTAVVTGPGEVRAGDITQVAFGQRISTAEK